MTTQQDALNWISQQVGKSLDFDGHYGAQCVDLIEFYLQHLGIAPFYGNAKDFWESGFNGGGQLTRSTTDKPGAIVVFKPNAGNEYNGHLSLEHDNLGSALKSLDQNWYNSGPNGSPAAWVTHAKDASIYGYLIPNFQEVHVDTPINSGDLNYISYISGLAPDTLKNYGFVGKPWKDAMYFLGSDQIYKDHGLPAQVQSLTKQVQSGGTVLKSGKYIVQ